MKISFSQDICWLEERLRELTESFGGIDSFNVEIAICHFERLFQILLFIKSNTYFYYLAIICYESRKG